MKELRAIEEVFLALMILLDLSSVASPPSYPPLALYWIVGCHELFRLSIE